MEKIVILDGLTLGNINLDKLKQLGEIIWYDWTRAQDTAERIKDADIVITNKVIISEKELKTAKKLKLICVAATGYNNIDLNATKKHNVVVANVKGYSTTSVAQYVFAHLLAVMNKVIEYQNIIKNGFWSQSKVFTILDYEIRELAGKNMGIVGYGAIGKKVAAIARAFDMNVLVAKRPNVNYTDNFRLDFDAVLSQSDVFSIHTPLTDETKNLITTAELSKMKKGSILINAARGGIVNEQDLFYALRDGWLKAAIVDVLTLEPPLEGNVLFSAPNIMITPHIAWTSREARERLIDGIISNIQKFREGKIQEIAL